jgi:hypothetical protein
MKIIVTESSQKKVLNRLIAEESGYLDKVLLVKSYLDNHFSRQKYSQPSDENGEPFEHDVVGWVDSEGEIVKLFNDYQLFDLLQEKFKNIIADKDERDSFLKKVIIAWYQGKIDKNGVIV